MDDIDGDERGGRGLGREIMLVVEAVKRVISHKFKRNVNILFKDETEFIRTYRTDIFPFSIIELPNFINSLNKTRELLTNVPNS